MGFLDIPCRPPPGAHRFPAALPCGGRQRRGGRRRPKVASLYLRSQPARHSLWSKAGAGRRGEGAAAPGALPGAGSRSAQPPVHSWCGADPGSPIGSHDGSSQESPCPSQDRSGRGRPTLREGEGGKRKGREPAGNSKAARRLASPSFHALSPKRKSRPDAARGAVGKAKGAARLLARWRRAAGKPGNPSQSRQDGVRAVWRSRRSLERPTSYSVLIAAQ